MLRRPSIRGVVMVAVSEEPFGLKPYFIAESVATATAFATLPGAGSASKPQVAFYGRKLDVIVDRPFGLTRGEQTPCATPCAIIDDARFGGVRLGPGPRLTVGPIVIRFPPGPRP